MIENLRGLERYECAPETKRRKCCCWRTRRLLWVSDMWSFSHKTFRLATRQPSFLLREVSRKPIRQGSSDRQNTGFDLWMQADGNRSASCTGAFIYLMFLNTFTALMLISDLRHYDRRKWRRSCRLNVLYFSDSGSSLKRVPNFFLGQVQSQVKSSQVLVLAKAGQVTPSLTCSMLSRY